MSTDLLGLHGQEEQLKSELCVSGHQAESSNLLSMDNSTIRDLAGLDFANPVSNAGSVGHALQLCSQVHQFSSSPEAFRDASNKIEFESARLDFPAGTIADVRNEEPERNFIHLNLAQRSTREKQELGAHSNLADNDVLSSAIVYRSGCPYSSDQSTDIRTNTRKAPEWQVCAIKSERNDVNGNFPVSQPAEEGRAFSHRLVKLEVYKDRLDSEMETQQDLKDGDSAVRADNMRLSDNQVECESLKLELQARSSDELKTMQETNVLRSALTAQELRPAMKEHKRIRQLENDFHSLRIATAKKLELACLDRNQLASELHAAQAQIVEMQKTADCKYWIYHDSEVAYTIRLCRFQDTRTQAHH